MLALAALAFAALQAAAPEPRVLARIPDDAAACFEGGGKRFLADDVDTPRCGMGADLLVGGRWRDDVDKVGLLLIEHVAPVGVAASNAELCHQGPRLVLSQVAQSGDADFGDAAPGFILEA